MSLAQDRSSGDASSAIGDAQQSPPQVFVRPLSVPAGWPWEQARAADLEARHGAPLPISDLLHKVRRLTPWGPGRPGRYAAFYVRLSEYRRPFETTMSVDGQAVSIAFGKSGGGFRQAPIVAAAIALVVATGAVFGGGLVMAIQARALTTGRLEADEVLAGGKLKSATALNRRRQQSLALKEAAGQSAPVAQVLSDLGWVAASRAPDARIAAFHWDHGLTAVEVRGDAPPFAAADRRLERSKGPIRAGVWLWGIHPAADPQSPPATAGGYEGFQP